MAFPGIVGSTLVKHKSEVFDLFKVFQALVENQSQRRLNIIRYDNGGEYFNSNFIQYYKDAGIQMQHSIPYTPQQNGVAERKNRSLKEMATCMMEAKDLRPKFWVEAIKCASYIQNRVPHRKLDGITPFEAWSGHKPNVTQFRIFGSKAWARIPIEKRKDLQPKSKSAYLLGILKIKKGTN